MTTFGSGELDFYLKTDENEFVLVIQDEHKDVKFTTVDNIRAATLFDKAMREVLEATGTLVENPPGTPETLEKVHISTLKWLYYCAIEDLVEAKANPRPTYYIIDEIIALEARIPKMEEMLQIEQAEDGMKHSLLSLSLTTARTDKIKLQKIAYYFRNQGYISLAKQIYDSIEEKRNNKWVNS